jgi:hypothetical protein
LGLGLVFMLAERFFGRSAPGATESRWSAPVAPAIVVVGFSILTVLAAHFYSATSPWPWLAAALGHALLLHVQGRAAGAGPLRLIGAAGAGLCLGLHLIGSAYVDSIFLPAPAVTTSWMLGAGLAFLGLAFDSARRDAQGEARWAAHAAALFACLLLGLLPSHGALMATSAALALGRPAALAMCALVPALVRGWSGWYVAALALFLVRRTAWIDQALNRAAQVEVPAGLFWFELAVLALLAAAPLVGGRLARTRGAWPGSALFLCLSLWSADRLLGTPFAAGNQWPSALALCALTLLLALLAQRVLAADPPLRQRALRWLLGAAALLGSLALARLVDHDVFIVATALMGLGLALLWRALPAFGLKFASLACVLLSAYGLWMRVMMAFGGQEHFLGAEPLLWNWTSYASAVPTLCACAAAILIGARERERATEVDPKVLPRGQAWVAPVLGLAAAGMARRLAGLRQISLVFLLLTLVKVFLHDLGDLRGLYRVGSLAGLAVSLLLVSLLYQRFVFPGRAEGAREADAPPEERPGLT